MCTPMMHEVERTPRKSGRPRLDDDLAFVQHFATVLPRVSEGTMSQRKTAPHKSYNTYAKQHETNNSKTGV